MQPLPSQNRLQSSRVLLGSILILMLAATGVEAALTSAPCERNEECADMYNDMYECSSSNRCVRKHYSYSKTESIGMFLVVVISAITNAGGVGAGTVVVPLYILFLDFVSSDAVHLSRITIFAGAMVNFFINWKKRDPTNKDRLIINYNLAAVLIPLHLAGAEIGVIIGKFLPAVFVTAILLLFIILSIFKTYQRGKQES